MSFKSKVLAGIGAAVLLWFASIAWDYFDQDSIPHVAMRYSLSMFGSAMYEYHSVTGRWPTRLEDLAQTTLPVRSPIWRQSAATMTFLWPQNLKPDPKDNAGALLAYTDAGLFNKLGRMWVCWGDLRTEHLPERELRARLAK